MRVSAALLAQVALSTAIVIPKIANISPEDIGVELSFSRIVRIPCTGCPLDTASDLIFDFNLPGSNPKELSINGIPVVPIDVAGKHSQKLMAPVIPREVATIDYFFNPDSFKKAEIGYALLVSDSTRMLPVPNTVHSIELNALSVNNKPVHIEGVAIDVHENLADGTLALGAGRMVPVSEQCGTNIKCMISKIKAKLNAVKGRLGCGDQPAVDGHKPLSQGSSMYFEPAHGRPHAQHHGQPSFFNRAYNQVLLPVFIGLLAGMAFGAFALVATHAFLSLFRRCTGRSPRFMKRCKKSRGCRLSRRQRRRQQEQEQGDDEEKDALMTGQAEEETVSAEAPPAYDTEIAEGLEVVEKQ